MRIRGLTDSMDSRLKKGLALPVMEQFHSLQGEGYHTGKAANFIRIGGCDVGCHWCDVKESWDASIHPLVEVEEVVRNAASQASRTVVITGGEPLLYNLSVLTDRLHREGSAIHLETSGAHPLSGTFDWICLSPKKNAPPAPEFYEMADELKIIVHKRHDFEWAEQHAAHVKAGCKRYLQPEWSNRDTVMPMVIGHAMQHPEWNISLQSHKYMNIP